jgi:hypothetical protein
MVERTKDEPIFESNPLEDEENPRYIASRQIGVIKKNSELSLPANPIPTYVAAEIEDGNTRRTTQGTKDS